MKTLPPKTIKAVEAFINYDSHNQNEYQLKTQEEKYKLIKQTTWNLFYVRKRKNDKTKIIKYLSTITGYEPHYLKRLIKKSLKGKLHKKPYPKRNTFYEKYTSTDIMLLAELDMLFKYPNGISLAQVCKLEFTNYNNTDFTRLSEISKSYIYNLRQEPRYQQLALKFTHTQKSKVKIVKRAKPHPNNIPGFIRVDSVHYGDHGEDKGCFFINLCDEVTQWEVVICVTSLLEEKVIPSIVSALEYFPFKIIHFHSDNGSEFINHHLAELLNARLIEQTKSRARHSTDNGLIESKNAHVVRKYFGHFFISSRYCDRISIFLKDYFYQFMNFYRVCLFPTKETDDNGKETILYKQEDATTPLLKLKSVDPEGKCLKEGLSYERLEKENRLDNLMVFMRRFDQEFRTLFKDINF